MKATDFYSENELNMAQEQLGMSFLNFSEKKKAIITTIYQYNQGWMDEHDLDSLLTRIITSANGK